MYSFCTLAMMGDSSIDGNTTGEVSSPAFALASGLAVGSKVINRHSFDAKKRLRDDRARMKRCARPRVHSQDG